MTPKMATDKVNAPAVSQRIYLYFWNRMGRKGHRCKVLARGKLNSCLVEFEDGFMAVTSRNALRRNDEKPRS